MSFNIKLIDGNTGSTLINRDVITVNPCNGNNLYNEFNSTFEVLSSGGRCYLYKNGSLVSDIGVAPANLSYIQFTYTQYSSYWNRVNYGDIYIDDISTEGSSIGTPAEWNELANTFDYSYRIQAFSSYPTSIYKTTLYSLTNPDNAGLISSQNLTVQTGITNYARSLVGDKSGLYLLELTRDDSILRDTYFYYYLTADPKSYPELLLLGSSSVNADIRDEDQNGGEIAGGGSVYLYPDINTPADYTFTYDILETPYAISTEFSTVYNTSSINSLTLNYTGLSSQNYKVSVDGAEIGSTNGSDTFSYTFTGSGLTNNHIISFAPDYTISGVWGEVKDSVTQAGIKSATVSITGDSFAKTIYTDDNGLFYLTKGLEANKTYSIAPTKQGYTTPPSQSAITINGATTRQDFYMDPIEDLSGSGLYYAPHTVTFSVYEYWYNTSGLYGCSYSVVDENGTSIKTGTTDSKGQFAIKDMDPGIKYTITLSYNGSTDIEYITPGLTEYTLILNKESAIVQNYINPWLTLTYTKNPNNVTVHYTSNKTIAGGGSALMAATAGNGSQVYSQSLTTNNGTFLFNYTNGTDYILSFNISTVDGSTASQNWIISAPATVTLFPSSYPTWLKNLLFTGICIIFLLAFGKSRNEIACGSVAVLSALGYYFGWLSCSYYFVILIWIIALGAFVLHYKRTGALG